MVDDESGSFWSCIKVDDEDLYLEDGSGAVATRRTSNRQHYTHNQSLYEMRYENSQGEVVMGQGLVTKPGTLTSFVRLCDVKNALLHENVLQELHNQNDELISFFCRKESLDYLVHLVTVAPPDGADHLRQFVLPFYATEVFCCGISRIEQALLLLDGGEEARRTFWDFLKQSPPLNATLAGYFSRCWQSLLRQYGREVCEYLSSRDDVSTLLAAHLYSRSISDLFKALFTSQPGHALVVPPTTLVQTLFALLEAFHDVPEEKRVIEIPHPISNVPVLEMQLDLHLPVTMIIREIFFQRSNLKSFTVVLAELVSERCVGWLLDMLLSDCSSCLSVAVAILTDLISYTCVGNPLTITSTATSPFDLSSRGHGCMSDDDALIHPNQQHRSLNPVLRHRSFGEDRDSEADNQMPRLHQTVNQLQVDHEDFSPLLAPQQSLPDQRHVYQGQGVEDVPRRSADEALQVYSPDNNEKSHLTKALLHNWDRTQNSMRRKFFDASDANEDADWMERGKQSDESNVSEIADSRENGTANRAARYSNQSRKEQTVTQVGPLQPRASLVDGCTSLENGNRIAELYDSNAKSLSPVSCGSAASIASNEWLEGIERAVYVEKFIVPRLPALIRQLERCSLASVLSYRRRHFKLREDAAGRGNLVGGSVAFCSRWKPLRSLPVNGELVALPNGTHRAVGIEALELLTLAKALLRTNSMFVSGAVIKCGLLELVVSLLFAHPWNTLLHISIMDILRSAIICCDYTSSLEVLLENTELAQRSIDHFRRCQNLRSERVNSMEEPRGVCSSTSDRKFEYTRIDTIGDSSNSETCGYTSHLLQIAELLLSCQYKIKAKRLILPSGWEQVVIKESKYYHALVQNTKPRYVERQADAPTIDGTVRFN